MKYTAFLRGVNVGGKNTIRMEALRETIAALGFQNVKTYINSGNVIFETAAKADDKKLAARIGRAIETDFSLSIRVMVRSTDELRDIVKNNPFAGQFENDKDLHVLFLEEALTEEQQALLLANNSEKEMFAVRDREIFYLLKAVFPESLLGKDYVGKKLKAHATARNWRTVNKILSL